MRISHWLTRLQNRRPTKSTRRRTPQQSSESLEQRTMLTTVGVPISPTELSIFVDDGDSVTVQRNSTTGNLEVLDAAMQPVAAIPSVQASVLTALNIFAGDSDNTIDVSALTTAEFSALTTIMIDSGDGDDVITGSADFAELIDADDGNDTINGGGGDDTIDAGDGNDLVTGGAGNDSILGGNGQDTIDGGTGSDNIDAGDGQDSVDGGDGDDVINAGDGRDTVNGGAGADNINGMSGTDLLNGDADNDTILGGSENDTVNGGDGNDIVNGQAGNDTVSGDAGDDTAYGGGGRDSLLGGDGDDIINGQSGNDTLNGEAGSDRAYGGSGNDSLDGGGDDDTLRGHSGNDTLNGGPGDDNMDGGSGDDLLFEVGGAVVLPTLSISDAAAVTEGNAGSVMTTLTITLSVASTSTVTVNFETSDGSATVADNDYVAVSGQLVSFAPGVTSQTVTVTVNGDTQGEVDEFFLGQLTVPVGATLFDPIGTVAISDDDSFRLVATGFGGSIYDVDQATGTSTLIGNSGFSSFHGLTRGQGSQIFGINQTPTLQLLDVDPFTATATLVGALTPQPTEFVEGDLAYDLTTDTIYASFASANNSSPRLYQVDPLTGATVDLGPFLTNGTALAGDGSGNFINIDALTFRNNELFGIIPIGLGAGPDAAFEDSLFRIDVATQELTVVGPLGIDFLGGGSGLAYDSQRDVFVAANGNATGRTLYEIDVTTGAATTIGPMTGITDTATGLLFQPSPAPTNVSASNVTVVEGNAGTVDVTFTLTLSAPETVATTVDFTTVDSNAVAGIDYTAASGTVTFAAGVTSQTVTVSVLGDAIPEPDEVFFLQLSNPSGAVVLGNPLGIATITNDDADSSADTFLGGTGNDTIIAENGDDVINGGSGNDSISGGADNDSIQGGDGNDTIDGGSGDDTIAGQNGDDVITAGAGIDEVIWDGLGNGDDTLLASDGAETLTVQGDSGVNNFTVDSNGGLLRVTEGAASITVATSTTTVNVNGGSEADVITIGELIDVNPLVLNIDGQADNDTITAVDANIGDVRMFLNGGTGNDTITGSRDGDSINGDGGDDSVLGGLGNDTVDGGEGNDTLNGEVGNDSLLGNTGNDLMDGGDGDDILSGSLGNDTAIGGLGNDSLFGGFGSDVLNGNSGNDLADGGRDADRVLGGSGDDSLKGGTGDDTIRGQSGSDLIKGGDGNDNILGDSGNDVIDAGDGDDNVDGGNGNDIATGGDGNDTLNGMSGADTLLGGNGADNQIGGAGVDSLYGEEGDDSLNGGSSTDQFNGGEGADVLVSPDAGEVDNNNLAISASVFEALALLNGF